MLRPHTTSHFQSNNIRVIRMQMTKSSIWFWLCAPSIFNHNTIYIEDIWFGDSQVEEEQVVEMPKHWHQYISCTAPIVIYIIVPLELSHATALTEFATALGQQPVDFIETSFIHSFLSSSTLFHFSCWRKTHLLDTLVRLFARLMPVVPATAWA